MSEKLLNKSALNNTLTIQETNDLVEIIRLQLQSIDNAKKEKFQLKLSQLENQITLFKKQFNLFLELSKYFARRPISLMNQKDRDTSLTTNRAKKRDKEAEHHLFFEKTANNINSKSAS